MPEIMYTVYNVLKAIVKKKRVQRTMVENMDEIYICIEKNREKNFSQNFSSSSLISSFNYQMHSKLCNFYSTYQITLHNSYRIKQRVTLFFQNLATKTFR